MTIKFTSRIRKGNNNGTGFFYLPKDKTNLFNLGDWVRVEVSKISFFAKIIFYSHRLGIYVPQWIVKEKNLLGKEIEIRLRRIKGFYTKMYPDGRIYIPQGVIKRHNLKQNDIVLVKAIKGNRVVGKKYSKIHVTFREKRNQEEFTCAFDKRFYCKQTFFRIEKQPAEVKGKKLNPIISSILKDTHYAFIDRNSLIIFKGNKSPAIVNPNLKYSNLALYLGAYFADGTKKGNNWAICASTFKQARYYLKMHHFLIKDSKPEFTISFTNINNTAPDKVKRSLAKIWEDKTGIKVNKFRIKKPTGKQTAKWNKHGTLVIRENRQILLDFYNTLLETLIKEILSKKNKKLAIDFICGIMEGDGYAAASSLGSIKIWSNEQDVLVLKNILEITEMKYRMKKEGRDKYFLSIGALEVLRSLHFLKDKIFVLYPKRRKALFERLKTVGATKFLIENHESTSWVKAWFKDNGFCDKDYNLTRKGQKLSSFLLKEMKKMKVK